MNKNLVASILLAAVAMWGSSKDSQAGIVFFDNFDDGNVSDWTQSTNHSGATNVTVRTDSVVSPNYALYTYLDAPPAGSNLFVRASHDFIAPLLGDYTLSLWARSAPCQGCTMSYDVLLDGVSLAHTSAPNAYEQRTFSLNSLSAGTHILTLGIFTDVASSGRFNASFDDVSISTNATIPLPGTFFLMFAGLGGYFLSSSSRRA